MLEGLEETALLGCEQSKPLPLLISSQPKKQLTELVSDLYNQGQFEEVISTVDTLRVTYPDAFWLLNSQGGARHTFKAYDKALKIKPDYVKVHNNLGVVQWAIGNLEAAIASYRKALEIRPNYLSANFNMGNILVDKGDLDGAIDSYKRARLRLTQTKLRLTVALVSL